MLCLFVCVCMCVHVSLPPRLLIISGMIWCDMDSIWLVKQLQQSLYGSCMYVVNIVSRCGFWIEACCWNKPNKSMFNGHSKHLCILNKMECISCKGECGIRTSRILREELAWTINSWVWITCYLKQFYYVELKYKAF